MRLLARLFRVVWGSDVDRALRPLLGITLAGSLGGSSVFAFIGIWAIRRLHAGQGTVGTAFLVSALLGAGAGYLGGHLSDHIGRRPLMLLSWGLFPPVMLGLLASGSNLVAGLALFCAGGIMFQLGSAANQALVADLVPSERHEAAYAAVRVASNLGVTFGPPFGGLMLALGSWPAVFVGGATVSVIAFLLAWRYLPARGDYSPEAPPERGSFGVIARDRGFLLFLVSAALAWITYVAYEIALPISLVQSHGIPPAAWGFLVMLNAAAVTLFQLRLTRALRGVSAAVKLGVGLPLMGVPFLLLGIADPLPVIVVVVLLFVLGEMLWVPSSQSVVAGLAPADLRGAYMGAFSSVSAVGWALAPFLGLQLRAAAGDSAMWAMFACFSILAGITGAAACRVAVARSRGPSRAAEATA